MKTAPPAILLAIGAYFGFVVAVGQFHGVPWLALGLPSGMIATLAAGCGVAGAIWFLFANDPGDSWRPPQIMIALAPLCLGFGSYYGPLLPPPQQVIGGRERIMYGHLPAPWEALLAMTRAVCCA